ncbi:MAG: TIGR03032 family protein [Henriciella sp.]
MKFFNKQKDADMGEALMDEADTGLETGDAKQSPPKKEPKSKAVKPVKKAAAEASAAVTEKAPKKAPEKTPQKAPEKVKETASEPPEASEATASDEAKQEAQKTTNVSFSGDLYGFLAARNISLAFTSYQTGILYLLGHGLDRKLSLHQAHYPQAMGVVGDGARIYLASLNQIVRMENVLGPNQIANSKHDKVYVPRNFQTTGAVDLHEIGVTNEGKVVFINTKYSCLCELSLKHSFKPIWKPSFISQIVPEDRCHLNGLAMLDGKPKYASAVCRSDVVDGWRDRRHDGGIIIDIETDEIVAEGLSMPHSPRVYDGKLWVANSGSGEIGWIDEKTKSFKPVAFCSGFIRGLAFVDGFAIVTLSKPRYKRFDGLALADTLEQKDADPWCGVQVISLADGSVAHWIRFDGAIQEFFDICVLPGVRDALTIGPQTAEFNTFISIEPGLPQPDNPDALAAPEKPNVDVGPKADAPTAKADAKPAEKPVKPAPAKAASEASKAKAEAAKPKATGKPAKDSVKT